MLKGFKMTQAASKSAAPSRATIALAALGAGHAIAALGALGEALSARLLIAPLGATAALIWAAPSSPLAQPRAVIGGNVLSAIVAVAVWSALGSAPWAIGLSVALALALMLASQTLHAPACALPVFVAFDEPAAPILLVALMAAGASALVAFGLVYHRFVTKTRYPAAQA